MGDKSDLSLVDRINQHITESGQRPKGNSMPPMPGRKAPDAAAEPTPEKEPEARAKPVAPRAPVPDMPPPRPRSTPPAPPASAPSQQAKAEPEQDTGPSEDELLEMAEKVSSTTLEDTWQKAKQRRRPPAPVITHDDDMDWGDEPAELRTNDARSQNKRDVMELDADAVVEPQTDAPRRTTAKQPDAPSADKADPRPASKAAAPEAPTQKPAEPQPSTASKPAPSRPLVKDEQLEMASPVPGTEAPVELPDDLRPSGSPAEYAPQVTDQIKIMLDLLNKAGTDDAPSRDKLRMICDEIKRDAPSHDYGLIGWVAENLSAFLKRQKSLNKPQKKVAMAHLETMRQIIQSRITGDGGRLGNTLLQELTQITYADLRNKQTG
ncbi:MAG: hypothetical protein Alpg2KO_24280 [Alphaproteobacteria bacterium]